ncbi:alpha/beta fold hydrolase [Mycobacterium sp. URHB0044]|uniref:alpha/beta fold hydrolase n=1 Tax=Mycobacterium sp. URHB0044 TaxID=1380386 RepID=UPI0018CC44F3|nr:alpha/beta hydrolase [Mycobacterium sp. URHB0044]
MPGWKGSDIGLRGLIAGTVDMGFRVVTVNLPGAGISPSSPGGQRGLNELVHTIEQILFAIAPMDTPILLGHSFGATVAAAVAARRKFAVAGVLLVSPVVVSSPSRPTGLVGRMRALVVEATSKSLRSLPRGLADAAIRSRLAEGLVNTTLARRGVRGVTRIHVRSKAERSLAADPRAMGSQFLIAARHGCLESAANLLAPTIIIAGDRDQFSTVDELRKLCAALSHGHLVLVPGAGHLAHHEDTETLSRFVAEQVSELTMSRG